MKTRCSGVKQSTNVSFLFQKYLNYLLIYNSHPHINFSIIQWDAVLAVLRRVLHTKIYWDLDLAVKKPTSRPLLNIWDWCVCVGFLKHKQPWLDSKSANCFHRFHLIGVFVTFSECLALSTSCWDRANIVLTGCTKTGVRGCISGWGQSTLQNKFRNWTIEWRSNLSKNVVLLVYFATKYTWNKEWIIRIIFLF